MESLSLELKNTNIDINSIAPGPLNTKMLDEILQAGPEIVGEDFFNKSLKQKKNGGTPMVNAVKLILFLASSVSNGITGKLISALWDNWEKWPKHIDELSKSDIYTLRRIVGKDRKKNWGDK